MTDRVQVVAFAGSVLLLLLVLELVRRRRLAEEYSALWIVSALALIGISLRRDLLDFAAMWLGIYYPPAVLVLILVAIISVASLSFSVILSRQQRQIDWLIEENAVMAAELRDLRSHGAQSAPGGTDESAADHRDGNPSSGVVALTRDGPRGSAGHEPRAVPVISGSSGEPVATVAARHVVADPAQRRAESRGE